MALGPILKIFGGLVTGLKFMIFDGFPGGPRAEGALPGGGNLVHPWAPLQQPSSMEELYNQHAKYSIEPAGIKGYEKTRMQIAKI